jgi:hypothetical protein
MDISVILSSIAIVRTVASTFSNMDISVILSSIAIAISIAVVIKLHTDKSSSKTETFQDRMMTERKKRKADMRVRPESEANTPLSEERIPSFSHHPVPSEMHLVHGGICRATRDKGNCPLLSANKANNSDNKGKQ